jgi:immune inhibitor A
MFIILTLSLPLGLLATTKPKNGKFPPRFWRTIIQNPSILQYGDPGWMKRMEQSRNLRLQMALGKASAQILQTDNFLLPVLLGRYSDTSDTFTVQDFQNLLFDNNATGTLTDYFGEISYGQFNLTGSVFGWFTADETQAFYASDNNGLNPNFPQNGRGFVRNIVEKADPAVDFSQFDNDGPDGVPNSGDDDGYVDGIIVVYSGKGGEWGDSTNIWPHANNLGENEYVTNDISVSGQMTRVNAFAVCPEIAGTTELRIRPIGVFAHEFGHVLGLPDLYDLTDSSEPPDFEDSEGLGEWCLMAGGAWGGDGNHSETPAHMSAWCKIQMGWLTPTMVTENTNGVSIPQAETNATTYLLWEDGYQYSRYFLIENRRQVGFDQYLNGPGLLIYHVDEYRRWGRIRSSTGPVNDDEAHKMVDLEEADGNADLDNNTNRGDDGDPFPGSSNKRAFTDGSIPDSKDYDGSSTGVEIKNISDSGPVMTADIVVREPLGYTLAYDENGITGHSFGWEDGRDTWGGVLFGSIGAGSLAAVDLGFRDAPNNFELLVYRSFEGSMASGLLASVLDESVEHGWHTTPVPNDSVTVLENQDFFVTLKFQSKAFALTYDPLGANSERSFISGDGFVSSIFAAPGDLNIRARIRTAPLSTSVALQGVKIPNSYYLSQNFPNPFNPTTTIRYGIPRTSRVVLTIHNLLGQEVKTLVNEIQSPGNKWITWDGRDNQGDIVGSGIYIYSIRTGTRVEAGKMVRLP